MSADNAPLFLGIEQSLSGARWVHAPSVYPHPDDTKRYAARLSELSKAPPAIAHYLAAKGIEPEALSLYLSPTLRDLLPDPDVMRDVSSAARHIADAVMAGQIIGVFGDYDVDGACAAALFVRCLGQLGCHVETHIPDRFTEGYGPNIKALTALAEKSCHLILTVDCGITAHKPLQAAKDAGMDVIVIDHHLAGPVLPEACAVVNPNRLDDESGLGHLCAAGVSFMVFVAVLRELRARGFTPPADWPDLRHELDLVALATICDVVPLTGLNRAFVKQGLKIMGQRRKLGLNALADIAGMQEAPTPYALGFQLGPRINAGGRLGHSDLGVQLLSNPDMATALHIADKLNQLNGERRTIEADIQSLAIEQAETQLADNPDIPALIVSGAAWHEGVIGIVAGRLKDKYARPCLVITFDEETGIGKGSARGMGSIRLGDIITGAVQREYLVAGGGHNMAAGLTIEKEQLAAFSDYFFSHILQQQTEGLTKSYAVTSSLSVAGCTPHLMHWLEQAGPYGPGASEPRFVIPHCQIRDIKWMGSEKQHLSCRLDDGTSQPLRAVMFSVAGTKIGAYFQSAQSGTPVMVMGLVRRDSWRGGDYLQFQIEDIAAMPEAG